MMLEYKILKESIEKRQKLVSLINEKNLKKEKVNRKILAQEMGTSIGWIDKARKQINTEDLCITYNKDGLTTLYNDISKKGVYSKIIEMIEDTEIKFPIYILTNKQISQIYNISEKTAWMYRAFLNENLKTIAFFWDKNKNYLEELIKSFQII